MAHIGISAGMGAIQGGIMGAAAGPLGFIVGALVGGALGATVGALGTLLGRQGDQTDRHLHDTIDTDQTRATPVPLNFGRNRVGGNWIAVGTFLWQNDPNFPPYGMVHTNGILALCEGPVQAFGNIRQDGRLLRSLANQEKVSRRLHFRFNLYPGLNDQPIATRLLDPKNGYAMLPQVPWRNTAYLEVYSYCGTYPRLQAVNVDTVGPDYTIRRNGTSSEPDPSDVPGKCAFYDGYTFCFYYTLESTGITAPALGLARTARDASITRQHTPPPTGTTNIALAWYLGRHDVLVMQDPVDPGLFHVGYWGIDPSSTDWEAHRPDASYSSPIIAWHLDEAHGILHSIHADGLGDYYIMRWTLLTGRIARQTTNVTGTPLRMIYCAELDCYVVATTTSLQFIDSENGLVFKSTNAIPIPTDGSLLALCISGQMIGALTAAGTVGAGCNYYDPYADASLGPYGSAASGTASGCFGGAVAMHQNTFTGHVTIARNDGSFVNFVPSCIEDIRDINANGSSALSSDPITTGKADAEKDFQVFAAPDPIAGWIRDWSWRTYAAWDLVSLQGNSSLAAAMWNCCVDEPSTDSARWGAGFLQQYFDWSSFEGLHAFCVGGVQMVNADQSLRRAERYKCDYFLQGEVTLASLLSDTFLLSCQGWRTVVSGQLRIGIDKPGMWPIWHFSDRNQVDPSFTVHYIGRSEGINRVRIQYRDVLDEYRHDFAEARDDWDINHRHRVQQATIAAEAVGRFGHADLLAKAALDQSLGGRRQATWKSGHIAFLLSPTDPVEVSNVQCALVRVPMNVTSIKEDGKGGDVEIMALEHRVGLDALLGSIDASYAPGSGDDQAAPTTDCVVAECPLDGSIVWFNGGSEYQAGDYTIGYIDGSYAPDASWYCAVAGYQVVTRNSAGRIVVLGNAPAVSIAKPGWRHDVDAEIANAGESAVIAQLFDGPIGLMLPGGKTALHAIDADSNNPNGDPEDTTVAPTYQLCVSPGALCPLTAWNTGQNTASGGSCETDGGWTVNGSAASVATVASRWAAAPASCQWISAVCNPNVPATASIEYDFATSITVSGGATTVSGFFACDNELLDITVNGQSQGISSGTTAYGSLSPFTLSTGIVQGANAIVFKVKNLGIPAGPNPYGLLVQWGQPCQPTALTTPTPTPTPTPSPTPTPVPNGCDPGSMPSSVAVSGFSSAIFCAACANASNPSDRSTTWDGVLTLNPAYAASCAFMYIEMAPTTELLEGMIIYQGLLQYEPELSSGQPGWDLKIYCTNGTTSKLLWWGESLSGPTGTYTSTNDSTAAVTTPATLTVS